jgi:4-amino-4-deoxy-L-arabinose transferase-like glycosyltransferase
MSARFHTTLLILIFCAAGFFAMFHLKESPPVWYDEGFYVQSAANLATYGQTGLRVASDTIEPSSKMITVGYPLIYPLAGWFKIFGVSILAARSLMVLFILGFLLASYLLVKRLFNNKFVVGALMLLATIPTLYGNGKTVLGEVPGLLYLVLFLLFFNIAISSTTRKYLWLLFSGLFAGLCVVTKPTFLVLLPAIAVGVFMEWRRSTLNIKEILISVVAGIAPVIFWFFLQFQGGDSLSSILSYYANPYQLTDLFGVVIENIKRLFVGIGPLYLVVCMCVWIGALWMRWRDREKIQTEEIICVIFSVLIIAAYTRTPGWYRYLFEAQIISLLFFTYALFIVVKKWIHLVDPKKLVTVCVAVLSIFGAYQVMFSSFVAESYHRNKTAFLESYFAAVSSTTSFFFYNVPEAVIFSRNTNYYQYINPAGGSIGEEQLSSITSGEVDRIILGTDEYTNSTKNAFMLYKVSTTTHDYTILERK